jgi:hypothetical protein
MRQQEIPDPAASAAPAAAAAASQAATATAASQAAAATAAIKRQRLSHGQQGSQSELLSVRVAR